MTPDGDMCRILCGISAETIDEKDLSGSGTVIDPYVVRSTKGFLWLTNGELSGINLISKNVILACDIILNDESFDENGVPSGGDGVVYSWENIKKCKSLCFDGNNFSISGLYINTTGQVIASMMGEESAPLQEVKNLKMKNVFLKSSYRVAPICYASYVLKNCVVGNGYVYAGDHSAGIALFSNTVSNCVNKANIYTSSAQGTGGIVAKNYVYDDCVISNCINYGDIYTLSSESGYPARMGGIIGKPMGKARVENCKNFGDIISDDQQIGGIVGIAWAIDIIIQDCDNYGIVTGNFNIGGILGNTYTNSSCYISGCNNYGQVKAENWSVGLILGSTSYAEENTISIIDCCCDSPSRQAIAGAVSKVTVIMKNCKVKYQTNKNNIEAILFKDLDNNTEAAVKNIYVEIVGIVNSMYLIRRMDDSVATNIEIGNIYVYSESDFYNTVSIILWNDTYRGVYDGIVVDTKNRKNFYGENFDDFFINWKTGKLEQKSFSGKGLFHSSIDKNWLIENGYTKKA